MLYTYKKNEPQSDFFWQTIDLQRLPGTTVLRGSAVKPNINASGDFTGGCGIGENGVCAMELISDENSLTANKAWFFFDKEVVCLGNGINSTDENETETIIENRLVTDNSRFTVQMCIRDRCKCYGNRRQRQTHRYEWHAVQTQENR